jgi:hypothetical protein
MHTQGHTVRKAQASQALRLAALRQEHAATRAEMEAQARRCVRACACTAAAARCVWVLRGVCLCACVRAGTLAVGGWVCAHAGRHTRPQATRRTPQRHAPHALRHPSTTHPHTRAAKLDKKGHILLAGLQQRDARLRTQLDELAQQVMMSAWCFVWVRLHAWWWFALGGAVHSKAQEAHSRPGRPARLPTVTALLRTTHTHTHTVPNAQVSDAAVELSCFQALQQQEQLSAPDRIERMRDLLQAQREREAALQQRFKALSEQRDDMREALAAAQAAQQQAREGPGEATAAAVAGG